MPHKSSSKKKKHTSESSRINSSKLESDDFDDYDDNEAITDYDKVKSEEYDNDTSDSGNSDSGDNDDSDNESDSEDSESEDDKKSHKKKKGEVVVNSKTKEELKKQIQVWLDCDDRIKELNEMIKDQKAIKKEKENMILPLMKKMGIDEEKLDITDKRGNVRARVCRQKSVTTSSIKEDQVKELCMEIFKSEKKADQAVKKLEGKKKITERWYLKRTKGEGQPEKPERKKK
jgi:hypothetical protein